MEVLKSADRQYSLSASRVITFADGLAVAGTDDAVQDLMDIPTGARVVGGEIVVETAWDSGTSAVVDIGDGDDPDRYTGGGAVDLTSVGRTALTLTGFKYAGEDTIDLDPTFLGSTATAGQAYIRVEYVLEDRAHETQGVNVADYGSKNAPETP